MADDCLKEKKSEKPSLVSQKVLFVRNLPLSTTDQDLENVFSEIGPIKRAFVVRDKGQTEGCRGFGFVTFALVEDAQKAINTVTTFHGRRLGVCFANKRPKHEKRKFKQDENAIDEGHDKDAEDGQNSKEIAEDVYSENQEPPEKKFKGEKKSKSQRKNEGNELGRTVVITGLTNELKPNHIRKRCRKIGNVEKVTFPVEGREKATAFVVFESHKDAREVVTKLSGRIFKGNTINVVLLSREGKAPSQKSLRKSRLIVRNLSFKCKPEELRIFFSKFGQVTEVHIPTKSDGKRKCNAGFGFVQFSNVFEAAKAIKESNTKEIVGRPIAVDWAVPQPVYEKKTLDKDKSKQEEGDKAGNVEGNSADGDEDKRVDNEGLSDDGDNGEIDVDSSDEGDEDSNESNGDSSDKGEDHSGDKDEEDGENEDSDEEEKQKDPLATQKPMRLPDVKEGKTLFIRNLSFDSTEESLHESMEQFGEVEYCKVVMDKKTNHSRGMAFVKFKTVESAEKCLAKAENEDSGLSLDSFRLSITNAVTPGKAAELKKEKKAEVKKDNKDKRNLYLATEGLIYPGSTAAEGLSERDLIRRQKAEREKKVKLKDPNYFVSPTRLCVRNLPLNVDDKKLAEIFSTVTKKKVHVKKVLIMRSKDRNDVAGQPRSLGFGFVEFRNHKDALATLRVTNNNPGIFSADRRPIVEFAVENSVVVKAKKRRLEKVHHRQRQQGEGHAPVEKTKTNKEIRLEKKQKRREARQRKREEKKKRKLEETKEGHRDESNQTKDLNRRRKTANESTWKEIKGGQKFSPKVPVARKLVKNDQQERKQVSRVPLRARKSDMSTLNTSAEASPASNKRKLESSEKRLSKNIPKTAGGSSLFSSGNVVNKKRKGARRKEREEKEESNFSALVNKYKMKLFGTDEGQSSEKRSRWFDD